MFGCLRKNRDDDAEKDARLAKAEGDLRDLKQRAEVALVALDARHKRNHWRESIEQIIQGAT